VTQNWYPQVGCRNNRRSSEVYSKWCQKAWLETVTEATLARERSTEHPRQTNK